VRRRFVKRPAEGLFASTSTEEATSAVEVGSEPEERVELRFTISAEQYEAFERARAIVSRKTERASSVEECFHELVSFYVAKKAPRVDAKPAPGGRTRHIPQATRDAVLRRDGERCTFVGHDGRRCGARHSLQIDHLHPFALGGTNGVDNLRVLCAAHNRRRAERTFGRDFRRGSRRRE
jgi:5-methylcytosine-specific restriction endonuclease McrA